jgi:hypothetical protein
MNNYVYRINNKETGKSYIGIRSSETFDIGIKYFTSSKDKEFRTDFKTNPEKYEVVELANFKERWEAIEMEVDLHNWLDVAANPDFYNKAKQTSIGFDRSGVKLEGEDLKKQRIICKKRYQNPEERKKASERNKKRYQNPEERIKQSKIMIDYYKDPKKRKEISNKVKKKFKENPDIIKKIKETAGTKIVLTSPNEEQFFYVSIRDAAKYNDTSASTLIRYLKNGFPTNNTKTKQSKLIGWTGNYIN